MIREKRVEMHFRTIIGEHITVLLENVKARGDQLISIQNRGVNGAGVCLALKREDMVTLHKAMGDMLGGFA